MDLLVKNEVQCQEKTITCNIERVKEIKLGAKIVTNLTKVFFPESTNVAFSFNTLKKMARYSANMLYLIQGKVDPNAYPFLFNTLVDEEQEVYSIYDNKGIRNITRDALIVLTPVVLTIQMTYWTVVGINYMTDSNALVGESEYAFWTATAAFNFFKQIRKVGAVWHGALLYMKEKELQKTFADHPELKAAIIELLTAAEKSSADGDGLLKLQKAVTKILETFPNITSIEDPETQKAELKDLAKKLVNGQIKTEVRQFTAYKAIFKGLGLLLRVGSFAGLPVGGINKIDAIITGFMAAYKRRTWGPKVKAQAQEVKASIEKAAGKFKPEKVKKEKTYSLDPLSWIASALMQTPFKFKIRIIAGIEKPV